MNMQVRLQDETKFGAALPLGGSMDAPVPRAFQDVLHHLEESKTAGAGLLQKGAGELAQTSPSTSDPLASKTVPAITPPTSAGSPLDANLKQTQGSAIASPGPMPGFAASIARQAGRQNAAARDRAWKRGQDGREAGPAQGFSTLSQAAALIVPNQPLMVNDPSPTLSATTQTGYAFPVSTPNQTQAAPTEAPSYAAYSAGDVPQEIGLSTPGPNTGTDSEAALEDSLPGSVDASPAAASPETVGTAALLEATPVPKTDGLAQSAPQLAAPGAGARRMDANAPQPTPRVPPSLSTRGGDMPNTAHIEQISRIQPSQAKPQQTMASLATARTQSAGRVAAFHAPANNAFSALSPAAPLQTPEVLLSTQLSAFPASSMSTSLLPGGPDRGSGTQTPALSSNTGQVDAAGGAPTLAPGTNNASAPVSAATLADPNAGHEDLPTSASTGNQPLAAAPPATSAPSAMDHSNSAVPSSIAPKTQAASAAELTDVPSPTLTHARLMQTLNGSQMQVNLSTEEFGRISVHAGYSRDALTAQITLENSQLGSAITAHLPGAEGRLAAEHGLRTAITVATSTANGGSAEGRSGADQGGGNPYSSRNSSRKIGELSESSLNDTDPGQPRLSTFSPTPATSGRLNITI